MVFAELLDTAPQCLFFAPRVAHNDADIRARRLAQFNVALTGSERFQSLDVVRR